MSNSEWFFIANGSKKDEQIRDSRGDLVRDDDGVLSNPGNVSIIVATEEEDVCSDEAT